MPVLLSCSLMVAGLPLPQGDNSVSRLADALRSLNMDAKRVVTAAHHAAYRYANNFLASTHLLLGLLATAIPAELEDPNLRERIRSQLELYTGPIRHPVRPVHLPYTPHARAILINASDLASQVAKTDATTPDHLWSALKAARGSLAARCLTGVHPFSITSHRYP